MNSNVQPNIPDQRIVLTMQQWMRILDFLINHKQHIRTLLYTGIQPDMLFEQVVLTNIREGTPELSLEIAYPQAKDKIVVCMLVRPSILTTQTIIDAINANSFDDIVLYVANQVDITD